MSLIKFFVLVSAVVAKYNNGRSNSGSTIQRRTKRSGPGRTVSGGNNGRFKRKKRSGPGGNNGRSKSRSTKLKRKRREETDKGTGEADTDNQQPDEKDPAQETQERCEKLCKPEDGEDLTKPEDEEDLTEGAGANADNSEANKPKDPTGDKVEVDAEIKERRKRKSLSNRRKRSSRLNRRNLGEDECMSCCQEKLGSGSAPDEQERKRKRRESDDKCQTFWAAFDDLVEKKQSPADRKRRTTAQRRNTGSSRLLTAFSFVLSGL